jgi:hypothetical protein
MARGDIFICEECDHNWKTRGHGTRVCPYCGSNDILKEGTRSAQEVKISNAESERQRAEAEERRAEAEIIKEENKRKKREELINILGENEYHRRKSSIAHSNTNNPEKEKLKKSLGVNKKDFEILLKNSEERSKKSRINNIFIRVILIIGIFIFLVIPFSMGIFSNSDEKNPLGIGSVTNCSYKEPMDTGTTISFWQDNEENKYETLVESRDFNGESTGSVFIANCKTSFLLRNNLDKEIPLKVSYVITYTQDGKTELFPKSLDLTLSSFEDYFISDTVGGVAPAQQCSVSPDSVRINYLPNSELTLITEKVYEDVCKKCGNDICLNDNEFCGEDSECGSGICNIAGVCGDNEVVSCPNGTIGKNDQCVDNLITKFKKSYFKISPFIFILLVIIMIYPYKKILGKKK